MYGTVDKATGVNDNHIGIIIARHYIVTFGAQLSQNPFRINEVFWAAEGYKANTGLLHTGYAHKVNRK
ncbi:hypothetical protein D3C75_696680 [compost metagenome]